MKGQYEGQLSYAAHQEQKGDENSSLEFVNDWEKTPSGGVFSLD
jgi:hypothetical protein